MPTTLTIAGTLSPDATGTFPLVQTGGEFGSGVQYDSGAGSYPRVQVGLLGIAYYYIRFFADAGEFGAGTPSGEWRTFDATSPPDAGTGFNWVPEDGSTGTPVLTLNSESSPTMPDAPPQIQPDASSSTPAAPPSIGSGSASPVTPPVIAPAAPSPTPDAPPTVAAPSLPGSPTAPPSVAPTLPGSPSAPPSVAPTLPGSPSAPPVVVPSLPSPPPAGFDPATKANVDLGNVDPETGRARLEAVTEAEAAAAAPVQSVAGKTGAVEIDAADVGDAGTAGIAALQAETPAALREAAEALGEQDWNGAVNGWVVPRTAAREALKNSLQPGQFRLIQLGDSWGPGNWNQVSGGSVGPSFSTGGSVAVTTFIKTGVTDRGMHVGGGQSDPTRSPNGAYWEMPPASTLELPNNVVRRFHVFATGEAGAGILRVEQSLNDGSTWEQITPELQNYDTNTGNATPSPLVLTHDWNTAAARRIRVTCVSGSCRVWGFTTSRSFSDWNGSQQGGAFEFYNFSVSGEAVSNHAAAPVAFWDALLDALQPDAVAFKYADSAGQYTDFLPGLIANIEAARPGALRPDFILIGRHATGADANYQSDDFQPEDLVQQSIARDGGYMFVSPRKILGRYEFLQQAGLFPNDGLHIFPGGDDLVVGFILEMIGQRLRPFWTKNNRHVLSAGNVSGPTSRYLNSLTATGSIESVVSTLGSTNGTTEYQSALLNGNYREGYHAGSYHFAFENQCFGWWAGNAGFGNGNVALPVALSAGHTFFGVVNRNEPAMRIVAPSSNTTGNLFEINRGAASNNNGTNVFRIMNNGRPVVTTGTSYADHAAADADAALPSGAVYQLTGDRALYRKP